MAALWRRRSVNVNKFEVPVIGGDHQTLPRSELTKIIRPRLEETFEMVLEKINRSGLDHLAGRRAVLTGGAAQLNGAPELVHTVMEKQTRLAAPMRLTGLPEAAAKPSFAACAGLLTYACLLYTSPSPRDGLLSRMPSSA